MNIQKTFVLLLSFGLYHYTSAHAKDRTEKSFMVEESLETQKKSKHYDQFFKACLHQAKGENSKAHEIYKKIFMNQTPEACNKAYIKLLFDSQDYQKVIKKTDRKFTDDPAMQMLRAQSFLILGNDNKAEPILKKLVDDQPHDLPATYQFTVCLMRQSKVKDAIKTLDAYFDNNAQNPQHAMLHLLKSKIFLMQNDQDQALDSVNKSLEAYPRFDQGILLKSMLLQQMGKTEEAISSFQDYLNLVNNPEAEKQLFNMIMQHKKYTLLPKQIEKSNITSAPFFYLLGNGLIALQQKDEAAQAFDKACNIDPDFTKAWLARIDITRNKDEQKKLIRTWIKQAHDRTDSIKLLSELRQTIFSPQELISFITDIHQNEITTPETLSLLVDLYYEQNEYQKGLDTIKQIFSFSLQTPIHASVLFNQAYAYWMMDDKKACIQPLEKALALNPHHTASANLLALCYVAVNDKIDKAEQLIKTVLEKDPTNQTFIQTKEQVLLKKQQLEKDQAYHHYVYSKRADIEKKLWKQKKQPML